MCVQYIFYTSDAQTTDSDLQSFWICSRVLHGPKIHGPARPFGVRAQPVFNLRF